jgi:predicted enzyme related to lactoylglutathione lyase
MAKIESYAPGSFCWAELATGDPDGARKFYTGMFGWTPVDMPIPGGVYTIFQSGGNDAAAMAPAQPGVPTHWGVYFSTADVDASAAKVQSLGGKILAGPFDVMDAGRMAAAQDPQGAAFSLWQAKQHIGITHGGPLNQVTWPELWTPDPAGATAFYKALFGWKTTPETGVEAAEYVEWINGAQHIGGLLPLRGERQGLPKCWIVYVTVADCDERTAKARELGGKIWMPPTDLSNVGRFSVIADPQGAAFSLIQLKGRLPRTTA